VYNLRYFRFILIFCIAALLIGERAWAAGSDKEAVETVVRNFERATEQFEFAKANSMLAPDARWIEHANPQPAEFNGGESSKRWENYKTAKMRIKQVLRDFDIRVHGDVAWATFDIDSTWSADTEAALALNDNLHEWRGSFVESIVLVKIDGVWKIALGHTSSLPKAEN
jgi:ketosteroid isomerase-like protein